MCVCVCVCVLIFTKPFRYEHEVTEGQFLSEVKLIRIYNFASLRLVAKPSLKTSA